MLAGLVTNGPCLWCVRRERTGRTEDTGIRVAPVSFHARAIASTYTKVELYYYYRLRISYVKRTTVRTAVRGTAC